VIDLVLTHFNCSKSDLIACLAPERNVDTAIVDRLVEGIGILLL